MNERHQTSRLTKHGGGGMWHTIRYSFLARLVLLIVFLTVLTTCALNSDQGTENLIGFLNIRGI